MKQWLIIRYNNKDFKEKVFKTFNNEAEAVKKFEELEQEGTKENENTRIFKRNK